MCKRVMHLGTDKGKYSMNYTALLLDAFETDLTQRKVAGATDATFEGTSSQLKLRCIDTEKLTVVEGVPSDILRHIVKSIFGEGHYGSLVWRGFRMTFLSTRSGEKFVDHLTVRLTASENVERKIADEVL